MLWAKDVRRDMVATIPELDFATISRRLGEMWANVSSNEKYNWRRRAKRLAAKGKDNLKVLDKFNFTSKFINRNLSPSISNQMCQLHSTVTPYSAKQVIQSNNTLSSDSANIAALDVAAYLRLLGDSLTIIGQRLKEHEVRKQVDCRYI